MNKIVKENIEFKRGQSSRKTLDVGLKASIDNWFKTYSPDVKYEIDDNWNISVNGYLFLENTDISSLPNILSIDQSLHLSNSNITSLPDNLTVGGNLFLENTPISSLPDNLFVGRDLDLKNTNITSLPDNLIVGGKIRLKKYWKEFNES